MSITKPDDDKHYGISLTDEDSSDNINFNDDNLNNILLDGGTLILVNLSGDEYVLRFSKDDNIFGKITITPETGYKLNGLKVGADETWKHEFSHDQVTSGQNFTTENVDPNYTGTIDFQVVTEAIPYGLDLYYRTMKPITNFQI